MLSHWIKSSSVSHLPIALLAKVSFATAKPAQKKKTTQLKELI